MRYVSIYNWTGEEYSFFDELPGELWETKLCHNFPYSQCFPTNAGFSGSYHLRINIPVDIVVVVRIVVFPCWLDYQLMYRYRVYPV